MIQQKPIPVVLHSNTRRFIFKVNFKIKINIQELDFYRKKKKDISEIVYHDFFINGNCSVTKHGPELTSTARLTSPWLAVLTASLVIPFNCVSFADIQDENSEILK